MIEFTRTKTAPRNRVHRWINTDTLDPMFGIQANIAYGKWAHVVDGDSVLFFTTKEEAKAEIAKWTPQPWTT